MYWDYTLCLDTLGDGLYTETASVSGPLEVSSCLSRFGTDVRNHFGMSMPRPTWTGLGEAFYTLPGRSLGDGLCQGRLGQGIGEALYTLPRHSLGDGLCQGR